jgi:hypothetical protein
VDGLLDYFAALAVSQQVVPNTDAECGYTAYSFQQWFSY